MAQAPCLGAVRVELQGFGGIGHDGLVALLLPQRGETLLPQPECTREIQASRGAATAEPMSRTTYDLTGMPSLEKRSAGTTGSRMCLPGCNSMSARFASIIAETLEKHVQTLAAIEQPQCLSYLIILSYHLIRTPALLAGGRGGSNFSFETSQAVFFIDN